ncbi:iron transporter [Streptomyces longispororuber]|uniref:Iron transporter n=1 Tax=Streptomyces longispororuber TaxID=68230 RepID=A0A918ZKX5_9ACTN|nr:FTR1 family protein [Streptomyces longispororuber]GHE58558.1 iron transporter [Streptomyces longispororuber]
MWGTYVTGLRGGLEAAVAVGLLLAYAAVARRRDARGPVAAGAGAAGALCLGFGCAFTFGSRELTYLAHETLGGVLSVLAAGALTWLVVRARRDAAPWAAAAFLGVAREGLVTSESLWESVRAAREGTGAPSAGLLLGLLTAAVLAALLARGAARLPGAWAGVPLALVAAGGLASGVRHLQEAGRVGGLETRAFDVVAAVPPDSWYGALLQGVCGFQPGPTALQAAVWALYLVPVLVLARSRMLAPDGPPVGFGPGKG